MNQFIMFASLSLNIIVGLASLPILLWDAHLTIKHSCIIAKKFGISEVFIGLTLLSIGTSVPELMTHIVSSLNMLFTPEKSEMLAGIAIGTNIGSNIFQITAILGIVGIAGTIKVKKRFLNQDYLFMLLGIFILWVFCLSSHTITRLEGLALILLYVSYLYYLALAEGVEQKMENHNHYNPLYSTIIVLVGLVLVVGSADIILQSAIFVAEEFHISGSLIGALVIGVATALPELTTSLMGLKQGSGQVSLGILIGSNITNPMLGIGIGAFIVPNPVEADILNIDIPFWFVISLIGWILFRLSHKVGTRESVIMILGYCVYLYLRLPSFG